MSLKDTTGEEAGWTLSTASTSITSASTTEEPSSLPASSSVTLSSEPTGSDYRPEPGTIDTQPISKRSSKVETSSEQPRGSELKDDPQDKAVAMHVAFQYYPPSAPASTLLPHSSLPSALMLSYQASLTQQLLPNSFTAPQSSLAPRSPSTNHNIPVSAMVGSTSVSRDVASSSTISRSQAGNEGYNHHEEVDLMNGQVRRRSSPPPDAYSIPNTSSTTNFSTSPSSNVHIDPSLVAVLHSPSLHPTAEASHYVNSVQVAIPAALVSSFATNLGAASSTPLSTEPNMSGEGDAITPPPLAKQTAAGGGGGRKRKRPTAAASGEENNAETTVNAEPSSKFDAPVQGLPVPKMRLVNGAAKIKKRTGKANKKTQVAAASVTATTQPTTFSSSTPTTTLPLDSRNLEHPLTAATPVHLTHSPESSLEDMYSPTPFSSNKLPEDRLHPMGNSFIRIPTSSLQMTPSTQSTPMEISTSSSTTASTSLGKRKSPPAGGPAFSDSRASTSSPKSASSHVSASDSGSGSGGDMDGTTTLPSPNGSGGGVRLPPILQVEKQRVTTQATSAASASRRTNEAQFHCPVPGCGSSFTRRFNLRGHLRSHTEERPFLCEFPECNKSFARKHDCNRHMSLHSSAATQHQCGGCGKAFSRMDALNRHLRSEGGTACKRAVNAQARALTTITATSGGITVVNGEFVQVREGRNAPLSAGNHDSTRATQSPVTHNAVVRTNITNGITSHQSVQQELNSYSQQQQQQQLLQSSQHQFTMNGIHIGPNLLSPVAVLGENGEETTSQHEDLGRMIDASLRGTATTVDMLM